MEKRKENKHPLDKNGNAHGLWEAYYSLTGNIMYKGHYNNDIIYGYWEFYRFIGSGVLDQKIYFII